MFLNDNTLTKPHFVNRIRVGKIKHVLFTSLRPESFAGFFGFLLTVAQSFPETPGGGHLRVYAPAAQFEAISAMYSRFTYHGTRNLQISYRDIDPPYSQCHGVPGTASSSSSEDSQEEVVERSRSTPINYFPESDNDEDKEAAAAATAAAPAAPAPAAENTKKADDVFQQYKSVSQRSQYLEEMQQEELDESKDSRQVLIDDADLKVVSFRIWSVAKRFPHSFAYLLLLKDKPGQLLVERCKAAGVPPGPLYAQLKAGQTITTADGRTVSPADVLGPSEPGPAFVILECPTLNHTHSLFESFEEVLDEEEGRLLGGRELRLVVHIAPQHVFGSPHYQRWLKEGFGKGGRHAAVKHIPLGADNRSEPCLITSSSAQVKLNAVDGTIFRALSEQAPPEIIETVPKKDCSKEGEDGVTCFQLGARQTVLPDAPTMLTYTFRPTREQPFSFSPASCRVKTAEEILSTTTLEDADFAAKLAEYHTAISKTSSKESTSKLSSSPKFKPNVLFLGTASATPGKQRNTSAILVNLRPEASMLLDCGEATYLQLQRFYGPQATKDLLVRLRAIFISHNHADHHFGLVRLLRERENELVERSGRMNAAAAAEGSPRPPPPGPLLLIAPDCIGDFLTDFGREVVPLEKLYRQYKLIRHEDLLFEREEDLSEAAAATKRRLLKALSLSELVTVRVPHCRDSHGIVLTTKSGEKIAYTGDTLFSHAFDQAARDASLLIHEATMNDDLAEEAKEKRHSTISQAIRAGFNCRARFTMLTHFSQRYAKIAPVDQLLLKSEAGGAAESGAGEDDKALASQLAKYSEDNVGFAFDFMHLELGQLWRAAKMRPLLETLFSEDIQVMSERREKTALKRKLAAVAAGDDDEPMQASSSSSKQ